MLGHLLLVGDAEVSVTEVGLHQEVCRMSRLCALGDGWSSGGTAGSDSLAQDGLNLKHRLSFPGAEG